MSTREPRTCACGTVWQPKATNAIPAHCPTCAEKMKRWRSAVALVLAGPPFAPSERQRIGEGLLVLVGSLLGAQEALAWALEIVERHAGRVEVADPVRVARALDAASKRILRRAGALS